jgi:alpha-N-arabinofuranosidase
MIESMKRIFSLLIALTAFSSFAKVRSAGDKTPHAKEYHVSVKGSDKNDGSITQPFKTIMAAANAALPGDIITVHSGTYRESIVPPRGGSSDKERIIYQAAKGEKVIIKGSERIKNWKQDSNSKLWKVVIQDSFFGAFNPYKDTIYGDWLERGRWCHTGEVYCNGSALEESPRLDNLSRTDRQLWYCSTGNNTTTIWANFKCKDPNKEEVEINVRKTVFYPARPGINYITVRGFDMRQAATPWAPPTAEQVGLIGTHWSKGWVIQNNTISQSKCVGITLGKYGDEWDNKSQSVEGYIKTIERAITHSWNHENIGSHIVRNNIIRDCGQAGIAGSLGAVFSTIIHNSIHDIGRQNLFWGYEKAGIKLHAAVDVAIIANHIYKTEGGIWLDWMAQGTRVSRNLLHDNRVQDLSLEVNHGPVLIDNNIFLSPQLAQVRLSQGVAFVHNLIAWDIWPTADIDERKTPYLKQHSTQIAGFHNNPCGDTRFMNNVFVRNTDLSPYDKASLPTQAEDNVYLLNAKPSSVEKNPIIEKGYNPKIILREKKDGWYLQLQTDKSWIQGRSTKVITGKLLGTAVIPDQRFENPDSSLVTINTDYFDKQRNTANPSPGPFEIKSTGKQKIKVW